METKTKIIIGGIVVVAIGVGYYFWTKKPKTEDVKPSAVNTNNKEFKASQMRATKKSFTAKRQLMTA